MSAAHHIYEDRENLPRRRTKLAEPSFQNKSNILTERTALGAINLNSNLRIQPERATKQGTQKDTNSYFSFTDENVSKCSKTSFSIHEDSSRSSTASSNASSNFTNKLKLKEISLKSISSNQSPKNYKSKGLKDQSDKSKIEHNDENEEPRRPLRTLLSTMESPMEIDTSISDSMIIDTPFVSRPEDILQRNNDDFWDVPEYAAEIYNYLREAEICHKPRPNYMVKQTDITNKMRWILVDWLEEVSENYNLHTETLYLAISYVDRFLSQMSVKREKLQLVGTTAMFIASKYEEIYPPEVNQFAYITDNTYRVNQILRMEHLILKVLSFDMAVPTAYVFVNKFAKMCKCNTQTLNLALYISELSMLDSDPFLRYLPSMIAASSIAIANYTLGHTVWSEEVEIKSRYTLHELRECYVNLHRAYCRVRESEQHSIRDKYKVSKWSCVSNIEPLDSFPW